MIAAHLILALALGAPPVPLEDAVLPPFGDADSSALGVPMPIEHAPNQSPLRAFYRALIDTSRRVDDPATRTREDQARIVVFGASHVAGDMITSLVRNELKSRYGDAGIGLIVPANPWRDYYNRDANISFSKDWDSYWVSRKNRRDDGRYGLAGVSFASSDRRAWAKVSTARESAYGREVDQVEVWYWRDERGGDLIVDIDGHSSKRIKTKPNLKQGERPGFAVWSHAVRLGRHEVEVRPAGNGPVTLFGVVLERKGPGVVMDSLGINGARATDQLEWDAGLFTEQLRRRDPDLVVLAYGTNDIGDEEPPAEYGRKLDLVINRVRTAVPEASCVFIGPSDRPVKIEVTEDEYQRALEAASVAPEAVPEGGRRKKRLLFSRRPRQQAIIDVQRETAWRYGCGYWNFAGAMGGDLSMLRWVHADEPLATPDYVHLTKLGYERITELFWDALMGPFDEGLSTFPAIPTGGPSIQNP